MRFSLKDLEKEYEKTEEDIKAVQSVGQIIGEVMKQLDDERCEQRILPVYYDSDCFKSLSRHPLVRATLFRTGLRCQ